MWHSCVPRAPVIPTSKLSGCWTQLQRSENSHICCFWDTQQHFLKTHFCLESGFLSFLELQKSPQYQSRDALNTSTQNLADGPTLANGLPGNRAEMPCIPVHTTWEMNLLYPIDPQYQSRDAMNTSTQNLADEPTLANGPPPLCTRAEMP